MNDERKLATIRTIANLEPIPNADLIEVATIDGWKVVVKKGDFQIGDKCVYCEIDSILPAGPEFEFLAPRHYRIKTIKLKGQLSQGICFPISILDGRKYGTDTRESPAYSIDEGTDVTGLLKITKYEPYMPESLSGLAKGILPSSIPKTDEERVQNIPSVLQRHKNRLMYITEKLNGTSMTVYYTDEFGVCSRRLDLKETEDNAYWRMARIANLEEKLKSVGTPIAIQGELIGHGIQKNPYKLSQGDLQFRLFNVFDINRGQYFLFDALKSFAVAYDIPMVPVLDEEFELDHDVDALLQLAEGKSTLALVEREGIVFRSLDFVYDQDIGRLSFKAISNKYLLSEK